MAINRSSQCNPPIILTKRTFAIFILISVKCNLSSHIIVQTRIFIIFLSATENFVAILMKSSNYVIYLKKRMDMGKCTSCILYIKQNPTTYKQGFQ